MKAMLRNKLYLKKRIKVASNSDDFFWHILFANGNGVKLISKIKKIYVFGAQGNKNKYRRGTKVEINLLQAKYVNIGYCQGEIIFSETFHLWRVYTTKSSFTVFHYIFVMRNLWLQIISVVNFLSDPACHFAMFHLLYKYSFVSHLYIYIYESLKTVLICFTFINIRLIILWRSSMSCL